MFPNPGQSPDAAAIPAAGSPPAPPTDPAATAAPPAQSPGAPVETPAPAAAPAGPKPGQLATLTVHQDWDDNPTTVQVVVIDVAGDVAHVVHVHQVPTDALTAASVTLPESG